MRKGPAHSACRLGQHQHIIPRQQWRVHARRDVGSHGPRVQADVVSTLLAMYSPCPRSSRSCRRRSHGSSRSQCDLAVRGGKARKVELLRGHEMMRRRNWPYRALYHVADACFIALPMQCRPLHHTGAKSICLSAEVCTCDKQWSLP